MRQRLANMLVYRIIWCSCRLFYCFNLCVICNRCNFIQNDSISSFPAQYFIVLSALSFFSPAVKKEIPFNKIINFVPLKHHLIQILLVFSFCRRFQNPNLSAIFSAIVSCGSIHSLNLIHHFLLPIFPFDRTNSRFYFSDCPRHLHIRFLLALYTRIFLKTLFTPPLPPTHELWQQ